MSTEQAPEPPQTAAALQGADVEVPASAPSGGAPRVQLDPETLQAAREALPAWDVQPDVLERTVSVPAEAAALQASLKQVAASVGRLPQITVAGEQVTVRIPMASGPPSALLELAAALDDVFSGSRATGSDLRGPGRTPAAGLLPARYRATTLTTTRPVWCGP